MKPVGLSIPDACIALGGERQPLSRSTIYNLINGGKLERRKIGRRSLITVESIEALMAEAA